MLYSGNFLSYTKKRSFIVVARNAPHMVSFDFFVKQLETKIFLRIKPKQKDVCGLGIFYSLGLCFLK